MTIRPILTAAAAACLAATGASAQSAAAAADTVVTACSSADHRAFDFWIGRWDVTNPAGAPAGRNTITRLLGGCALHEEWHGAGGTRGNSYSSYDRATGQWHQHWVDSGGNLLRLAGGLVNGAMVMEGETTGAAGVTRNRVTWSRAADGSVRQHWETSADGGATWSTSFDGLYRRATEADPPAAGPLASLAFMAGCWRGDFPDGAALEEYYTPSSGTLMLGVSRFTQNGRVVQHEFSRITVDEAGAIVLLPFPGGKPSAHGFRLTAATDGRALFEAPEHDFPRRIAYTRGADGSLTARIDGGDGDSRVQEWRMEPAACHGSR